MDKPVYSVAVSDNEELGFEAVALVKSPAILVNWMAFNDHQRIEFSTNNDRQLITGPIIIPDLPIYRKTKEHGEHYIVFTKEVIEQAAIKYFQQGNNVNVNLMHDGNQVVPGAIMFESFIVDSQRGIKAPFGDLPEGTWFASFKITDPEVWGKIKSGEFKGFSGEGLFKYETKTNEDERMIDAIISEITATA